MLESNGFCFDERYVTPTTGPLGPTGPTLNTPAYDESSIYEGGTLTAIGKDDLLGNKAAITQLLNAHNLSVRENGELKQRIEVLEREKIVKRLFPFANACLSLVNILGVILLGFGTTYMTQERPPIYCGVLIAVGVVASLVSACAQPFVPLIVKRITR